MSLAFKKHHDVWRNVSWKYHRSTDLGQKYSHGNDGRKRQSKIGTFVSGLSLSLALFSLCTVKI